MRMKKVIALALALTMTVAATVMVSAQESFKIGDLGGYSFNGLTYKEFQEKTQELVAATPAGADLTIDTTKWVSFNADTVNAIADSGLNVTVNYRYQGEDATVTIPAGSNIASLLNEEGYVGFEYLSHNLGDASVAAEAETAEEAPAAEEAATDEAPAAEAVAGEAADAPVADETADGPAAAAAAPDTANYAAWSGAEWNAATPEQKVEVVNAILIRMTKEMLQKMGLNVTDDQIRAQIGVEDINSMLASLNQGFAEDPTLTIQELMDYTSELLNNVFNS